ncbi:MAG: hypothetical protein CMJ18_24340 [Phycisphaeraceae bacterium]|nr:hypothetical protein [Phycisphaeraceae bacterium]
MSKTRRISFLVVIVLFNLVVLFFALEIAARLRNRFVMWRPFTDPTLGWSTKEYRRFNPAARPKRPGERRILVIGDSNLAGAGVRYLEHRFPVFLDEKTGPDTDVQIIASAGWGTDQELLAYMQKGKAWDPDIVVLTFASFNDLSNNVSHGNRPWTSKPYFTIDPSTDALRRHAADGTPVPFEIGLPVPYQRLEIFLLDLMRHGRTVREREENPYRFAIEDRSRVDERYQMFGLSTIPKKQFMANVGELRRVEPELSWSPQKGINVVSAFIHDDFDLNTYQWRLLEHILAEFRRRVEANGSRFIVMLLPVPFDPANPQTITGGSFEFEFKTPDGPFTFRAAEPRERLGAICARLDIEWFDPTPQFIDIVVSKDMTDACWPFPDDTHFSKVAHEMLADQLKAYLDEE